MESNKTAGEQLNNHLLTSQTIHSEWSPSPRVNGGAQVPRVMEERQSVTLCPIEVVLATPRNPIETGLASNTQSKTSMHCSITQEAILATMELTTCKLSAKSLASNKFPLQVLCKIARAVMDTNGDLLEYQLLMKQPEYWSI